MPFPFITKTLKPYDVNKNFPGSAMSVLDCVYVVRNMRNIDLEEFLLRNPRHDKESIIREILQRNGEQFTVRNRSGDPVIIGGTYYESIGVATMWFVATNKIKNRDWAQLVELNSILMEVMFLEQACHRIQAYVRKNLGTGHSWMSRMGLIEEGCLRGYFSNGEDCLIYGKVR